MRKFCFYILGLSLLFLINFNSLLSQTSQYEDLLLQRSGYAQNVTGGAGGDVITLTTLDFNALKSALNDSNDPKWIRFAPGLTGEIEIEGNLFIKSNKTIDGRGADITFTSPTDCDEIRFWGLDENWDPVPDRSNLIIHNIKIKEIGSGNNCGQGIGCAFDAYNIWIDHVTFTGNGDESFSTGKGAHTVTISWCRFEDTDKAILFSWNDNNADLMDTVLRATVHHSYFNNVNGRMPNISWGKVHYFNNYVNNWNWCAVCSYNGAEFYSEYNIYDTGRWNNSAPAITTTTDPWHTNPGYAKTVGDIFKDPDTSNHTEGPGINTGNVTLEPSDDYNYLADLPDDVLQTNLFDHAGWNASPQWPGNSFEVFNLTINTDGNGQASPNSGQIIENTNVVLNATANLGYTFDHWSGDISGSENPTTFIMDADKTITAHFVAGNTFNLTTTIVSGGGTVSPANGTYNEGTNVLLTAISESGYIFDSWGGDQGLFRSNKLE